MTRVFFSALLFLLFLSGNADAHTFQGETGFVSGVFHPVMGFDHLLAMLSVGIISAQIGGRAIWTVPLTFVCVMGLGGFLGMQNIAIPGVEYGIAFSVLILGIAVARGKRINTVIAHVGVAFFAVFHGHAHGAEMPAMADPLVFSMGFLLGTAAIHLVGVSVCLVAKKINSGPQALRYVGAGIAGIGVYIIHILVKF
ncbi:MAG: HupE/UreJ family protein [Desulfobulbaceae bacterium]|nr:HupE/UreJ family protein [Desulfobulbaceae bacterium]